MKEAAGEANMTVITIILIGVIAAVAIPIVNSAMTSTAKKGCCQNLGGVLKDGQCVVTGLNGSEQAIDDFWNTTDNKCKE